MATFNGGRYVGAQLDSILAQSCDGWRLLIRDDGSSDDTVSICQKYAAAHPGRIQILEDQLGRLNYVQNFDELLAHSNADYTMFSDHDDVWLPDKIEKSLAAMRRLEAQHGPSTPILVHTDSAVVDGDLKIIAPSLLRYLHRKPHSHLNRTCMEHVCYGHAIMINRSLRELSGRIPNGFGSWDWWLEMVAAAFGRIHLVDEPLVLYRRHEGVVVRTINHRLSSYFSQSMADYRRKVSTTFRQCALFYERFEQKLRPEQKKFFASVTGIPRASWVMRRILIIRHRLFKTGLLKTAGVLLAA